MPQPAGRPPSPALHKEHYRRSGERQSADGCAIATAPTAAGSRPLRGRELRTCVVCRLEQNPQEAPPGVPVSVVLGQVAFDLGDRFTEDVQAVPEFVELLTRHDELVLAKAELVGPAARFVVALAASPLAVLAWAPGAFGLGEAAAAPPAAQSPPG